MIAFAKESDRTACQALFAQVFGDPLAYIEGVFDIFFKEASCLVYKEEGQVVSMVLLPSLGIGPYRAGYIYGACTLSSFRGGGRMSRLMEAALAAMEKRGDDFAFLVPAEEGLIAYYARFGFSPGFYQAEGKVLQNKAEILPAKRAKQADFAKIHNVYQQENKGFLSINRDPAFYESYQTLSAPDGFYVCPDGYAYVDGSGKVPVLREVGGDFEKVAFAVMAALNVPALQFRLPAEEGFVFGCVRPVCGQVPKVPLRFSLLWD